ncbi:MAG: FAD-dependent oxidoreductase [Candidatus Gastranaerophilales bacterium]|nr:FAD-dependent oxidoreductase [Candidatus Gastranaerophilales bacterium]
MEKIVIIGGVAAGTKAAAKSRRLKPDTQIDIYTDDTHVSYSACGLPFFIEGNFDDYNMLIARTVEEFEESNIHIHLLHRCTKILPDKKQIIVNDFEKKQEITVDYDKLVIATGARPFIPPIKNVNLKNVFTLRTLEDGINIKEKVLKSKNAVIVGGGYIGIELLEAFVKQGLKVKMIEFSPRIMPFFDDEISDIIKKHILERDGDNVKIINSDAVVELIGENEVKGVKTKNGLEFDADLVIIATGVKPNVELAVDAGIELGETKAIKVNKKMQTNIEDIYAAGDCIEKNHIVSCTPVWVPLGSTANKEGRCAAINLCGEKDLFEGILGSAVTRYFGFTMSITGLTEKQALKLGYEPVSVVVTKSDKVGYMPEAKNITIKLIADKNSRKLLGAQGIGCGDADKRINTVAASLVCPMTVDDFFASDLTYAPPYSPSIDPLLTAAEKLIKKLNG